MAWINRFITSIPDREFPSTQAYLLTLCIVTCAYFLSFSVPLSTDAHKIQIKGSSCAVLGGEGTAQGALHSGVDVHTAGWTVLNFDTQVCMCLGATVATLQTRTPHPCPSDRRLGGSQLDDWKPLTCEAPL